MRRKRQAEQAVAGDRRKAFAAVAERFKAFRPAREVLSRVRAVPTIFHQFDHATGVGGLPIERFMLLHGPSSHGKTTFAIGLMKSFLERDHFVLFIDAERTTPITWVDQMMGSELASHPGFFAKRPKSYEETVDDVRAFAHTLAEARDAEEISPETSALIVVDSLRKLVPENIMKKIAKDDGKGGVDGMGGRAAQIKAAMNSAWLDELVPLLEDTGTGFIAIARETEDPAADVWAKRFGNDYKVGGGKAVYYDASLVMRVERAAYVGEKAEDGSRGETYGERHRVTIRKTKIAGREDRQTVCYFHTSNGVLVPTGFDTARDLVELAESFDIIESKGAWLKWGQHKWNGRHAAVKKLSAEPAQLAQLGEEVRAKFEQKAPIEIDEDGVVTGGPT
jgi:RecA/RadA recombinase